VVVAGRGWRRGERGQSGARTQKRGVFRCGRRQGPAARTAWCQA
jgi:hypothetical protein